ncbi:decaprenyl-phosphate phosphoribosyltransferase [Treponema sp.]|uniref:decaprenyl-phosphate phosphoribosyltransferase n=1 Tax=Treponema sp. TaxID=166 RepID=UPI003F0D0B1B
MKFPKYLRLARVHHWVKNLLVLLPAFFDGVFFTREKIFVSLAGFFSFCLASSAIYVINDIRDVEKDRAHNEKCRRPLASGEISIGSAWILFFSLIAFCILFNLYVRNFSASLILLLYVVLNVLYSFGLKKIPIVDLCILVSGFFLRVLYGSHITGCSISNWLYLMIITISFFMALGKRRGELIKNSSETRNVLRYYTQGFLDKNMYMFLAMANVFYALWSCDTERIKTENSEYLVFTVPLVILITLRYSFDVEGKSDGDPVEVLVNDKFLIYAVIAYMAVMCALFYL